MYLPVDASEPLPQGDIVDGCPVVGLPTSAAPVDLDADPYRWRERIIVLTQAWDPT